MIETAMEWYARKGMVQRYQVGGRPYYQITNWEKYQGSTEREAESPYPGPPDEAINDYTNNSREGHELVVSGSGLDAYTNTNTDAKVDAYANARARDERKPAVKKKDPEHQAAIDATAELMVFWQELTAKRPPAGKTERANDWLQPLNDLWIRAGRDTGRAKAMLQDGRKAMLGRGFTPYKPSGVVPAIIAELDGLARAPTNGNGHDQPATNQETPRERARRILAEVNHDSEWQH
jgi:hypothetical protein